MPKILERIKNFFSGKYIYRPKCCFKKEEPKVGSEQEPKVEQKPEEQK